MLLEIFELFGYLCKLKMIMIIIDLLDKEESWESVINIKLVILKRFI